jgi:hypothetical protein
MMEYVDDEARSFLYEGKARSDQGVWGRDATATGEGG